MRPQGTVCKRGAVPNFACLKVLSPFRLLLYIKIQDSLYYPRTGFNPINITLKL